MLTCEYCPAQARRNSGMAAHVRKVHPDKWKDNLKDSFSPGYNPGEQEPMRRKETSKLTEEQKAVRRKQQKDWYDKHKRKKKSVTAPPLGQIKFCPNCGYNLEIIMVAIGMAQRVSTTIAYETGRRS